MDQLSRDELIADTITLVRGEHETRTWDQDLWAEKTDCGTSCCVAGNIGFLVGFHFDYDKVTGRAVGSSIRPTSAGKYSHVEDIAAEALGLSCIESEWMFNPGRSQDELLDALDGLKNGVTVSETAGL